MRMLDIPPDIFDRAYNNVANSALWFVHHLLFDTPNQPQFGYEFRRDWESYLVYNEAFAGALAREALSPGRSTSPAPGSWAGAAAVRRHADPGPGLPPVPGAADAAGPAGRGGPRRRHRALQPHSLGAAGLLPVLPEQVGRALLDGILGADHAGFHAERWATAFVQCCAAMLGADVAAAGAAWRVTYRGHVTEVAVHPLGVDAPALRERARAGDVQAHVSTLRAAADGRKLIVRVDRTELSKNIVRGLAAYRELLTTRPQWRGRVVHLAFAYPSRSALAEYRAYTDRMRRLAQEISEEFGTPDWDPLILEVKDDYPRSLAACAVADVLLVNPVRDGMNLVAQEGPVLSERGCALVLSREAGAAATLAADALLVNPYDITETAEALHQALAMPDAERQRRSAALAAIAAADPPARWLGGQLASLDPEPGRNARIVRIKDLTGVRARRVRTVPCGPAAASPPQRLAGPPAGRRSRRAGPRSRRVPARPGRPRRRPAATRRWRWPRRSRGFRRPQRAHRGEGGQVPEVIAAEQDRTRGPLAGQAGQRGALVHARRAQFDDETAGLRVQPEPGGELAERVAEPAQRRFRVGRAAGVHRHRVRLVLDPGAVGRAGLAEHAGQRAAGGLDGRRGRGRGQLTVLPPLPAVVADHDEAGDGLRTRPGRPRPPRAGR